MHSEERIAALKVKHLTLNITIKELLSDKNRDDLEIAELKKQKLRIKDELAELTR